LVGSSDAFNTNMTDYSGERIIMRFLASLLIAAAFALPLNAEPHKVVLISIDGLRGAELASLPNSKLNLPNLNEIVSSGTVTEGMLSVLPSITYPNHTSMVTGVSPATHGILGNFMFDPEHKLAPADSWIEYAKLIRVPTLWDVAHDAGKKTASVYWPVTVGSRIDANIPEHYPLKNARDKLLYEVVSTPGLLTAYEKEYGALPIGDAYTDQIREQMAAFLVKTQTPDLLLVHFIDLDHAEHVFGPDSPEAVHALERTDHYVGMLRKAIAASGSEANTVFVIVSDHGFFPVDKSFHPNAVLTGLGLLGTREYPDKWRIAAFGGGGSFGLVAHDPADHDAIYLATKTFQNLQQEGSWGIDCILTPEQLKAAQGYSNSFLVAGMKQNVMADGGDAGPWLTNSSMKGMHGYIPGPKQMDASFAAFGPGIAHRRLARGHVVDVGPTVAALLGIQLPPGEGVNLLLEAPAAQGK
jgi:predicted AlkP superfamily pyrophosphatase or phosphodiesterase